MISMISGLLSRSETSRHLFGNSQTVAKQVHSTGTNFLQNNVNAILAKNVACQNIGPSNRLKEALQINARTPGREPQSNGFQDSCKAVKDNIMKKLTSVASGFANWFVPHTAEPQTTVLTNNAQQQLLPKPTNTLHSFDLLQCAQRRHQQQ